MNNFPQITLEDFKKADIWFYGHEYAKCGYYNSYLAWIPAHKHPESWPNWADTMLEFEEYKDER